MMTTPLKMTLTTTETETLKARKPMPSPKTTLPFLTTPPTLPTPLPLLLPLSLSSRSSHLLLPPSSSLRCSSRLPAHLLCFGFVFDFLFYLLLPSVSHLPADNPDSPSVLPCRRPCSSSHTALPRCPCRRRDCDGARRSHSALPPAPRDLLVEDHVWWATAVASLRWIGAPRDGPPPHCSPA